MNTHRPGGAMHERLVQVQIRSLGPNQTVLVSAFDIKKVIGGYWLTLQAYRGVCRYFSTDGIVFVSTLCN